MIDDAALTTLFDAIRKATPAAEWSTGVAMARDGKVMLESDDGDELTFRVVVGQRLRAPEVTLFPDDEDWQCDCGSRFSACCHIAAAVISLRQAGDTDALPRREAVHARLAYRFESAGDTLHFQRILVAPDRQRPFRDRISAWRDPDLTLVTATADADIERVMERWFDGGRVPNGDVQRLLQAVRGVEGVTLDGAPIAVNASPVLPRLRIQDAGRSYLAELVSDATVSRRYRNGAVIAAGELRPIDDHAGLEEWQRRELTRGRAYDDGSVSQLIELIARFEKLIPVDIRTRRLPSYSDVAPQLRVRTEAAPDGRLLAVADIVYGDPPFARVAGGRLELLGDRNEVPVRDESAERRLVQRAHAVLGLELGRETAFEGAEALAFAARLRDLEGHGAASGGVAIDGDAHTSYRLAPPLEAELAFRDTGGVAVSFSSEGRLASASAVLEAWRRGSSLVPLDDGSGWAPLPADWLRRFGPALLGLLDAKALADDGDDAPEPPASSIADLAALADALGAQLPPRFEKLRALVSEFQAVPAAPLPGGVTATLRPYQQAGHDWLAFHRDAGMGALLADDMGLGKTLQALVSARGRTLVVAPTSVLPNWRREAERFRPDLKVNVYHGPDRALDPAADLTLTTWALLRLDIEALAEIVWDTTILDESQTMKNPESQVAQAAYRLKSRFRVALTGTPLENRLEDLWSQMRYVEPGLLPGLADFRARYVEPISRGDAELAARLRARVRPFLLRRVKKDVAPDLPPRIELVDRVELGPAERDLYDAMKAATRKEVMEALAGGGGVIQALEALLRLRQAACHPGLLPGRTDVQSSAKVDQLLEMLETLVSEGHKVLVFSQWTRLLDLLEPHLGRARIGHLRLDGSTRDRQAVVDGFQADDGPPVLLLSLKAGGTGLNLTAADHVVLLDPWWNPAVEDQAADRAHRIGQDKPVMVHRMVAADTVEERILALQEQKRELARAAIGTGAAVAGGLTRDDLLGLLD